MARGGVLTIGRALGGAVLAVGLFTACGGPADSGQPSTAPTGVPSMNAPEATPSKSGSGPSVEPPVKDQVTVKITIANGQVDPNGTKIDVPQGATVVLEVTSDADDEIHAHTGGAGYELEVKAGQPVTGRFVATDPGSFEVESHHLEKIIVTLNVR